MLVPAGKLHCGESVDEYSYMFMLPGTRIQLCRWLVVWLLLAMARYCQQRVTSGWLVGLETDAGHIVY